MKTIKKDEIYKSLNGFLKSKGIKLSNGTYSKAVRKACGFLTDAVHLAQDGVQKTKVTVDSNLDKLRKKLHEATAPKPPKLVPKKKVVKKKAVKKVAKNKAAPKKVAKKTAAKAPRKPAIKKPKAKKTRAKK
jgi:hypothetical protein